MNIPKIPKELIARPQWVCYGKDKVPVNPKTGGNAQSNNPETWATFSEALKYYERHKNNGIAGIGYEFSYYDKYTGVDWDNCRDPKTGQLKFCAQILVNYLSSFTENSPSKTGIHILLAGKLPAGADNKKTLNCGGQIEVYSVDRYFTVTGNHLQETPATIEDRNKELKAFHAQVIAKPKAPPKSAGPRNGNGASGGVIDAFNKVYEAGSILEKKGYERQGNRWVAPTSSTGMPGVHYFEDTGRVYSHHASDPLSDGHAHDAFSVFCILEHGGDVRAAVKAAAEELRLERTHDRTQPPPADDVGYDQKERAAIQGEARELPPDWRGPQAAQNSSPKQESLKTSQSTATIKTVSGPPTWPREIMAGAAGNFSKTYAAYLETPESFLYIDYLTVLGHVISSSITLHSEIRPEPRMYTVNLGESADTRKSTSVNKACGFFSETLDPEAIHEVLGVGSAEVLAKAFKRNPRVLLVSDELNALVQKMRIDASVLSPCICTLFESNRFHSLTKKHEICIDDAELCMLAACTLDTYRGMFTSQFLDIGLLNRFFVVIGESKRKFAIPQPIPDHEKETLRQDLINVLSFVDSHSQGGRYTMQINSTAREIFDSWYFGLGQSVFTKRLDTYGHRLMPLLAVNELQYTITPEIAEKTVTLLNYQLAARKYADPIDADNAIAKLEERIRRLVTNGPMKKRDLERSGKKSRVGIFLWNAALKNLMGEEIAYDRSQKIYSKI